MIVDQLDAELVRRETLGKWTHGQGKSLNLLHSMKNAAQRLAKEGAVPWNRWTEAARGEYST